MLVRISLIVLILAGLAVGVMDFVYVKEKITTLQTNLANETTAKEQAQRELASTKKTLKETQTELTQTKDTLETTTKERDAAKAEAASQGKRATQLAEELTKTKKERDDAQAELASYKATGFSPSDVLALGKRLKQVQDDFLALEQENRVLSRQLADVTHELRKYKGEIVVVYLPATLTGKILVSDPKWDFVVLNIGADQGVKKDGELLVNRDGRLVAKVIVRSIQKDRCVANVMPGWKLGEVMEGDQVIPAHPQSS